MWSSRQLSTETSVSTLRDGRRRASLPLLESELSSLLRLSALKSSRDTTSMSVALSAALFGVAARKLRQRAAH